jgi:hypothetical protein
MPPKCPHCGRLITRVHRRRAEWLGPIVLVVAFFALLMGGVFGLVHWFGR